MHTARGTPGGVDHVLNHSEGGGAEKATNVSKHSVVHAHD